MAPTVVVSPKATSFAFTNPDILSFEYIVSESMWPKWKSWFMERFMPGDTKNGENAYNLMSYVTQGTVQIDRKAEDKAEVFISPTPDYAVKHSEKEYVVFVNAGSAEPQSHLFEKKKGFPVEEKHLIEMLTEAAFKMIKIEIRMNAEKKIEALKIPAML